MPNWYDLEGGGPAFDQDNFHNLRNNWGNNDPTNHLYQLGNAAFGPYGGIAFATAGAVGLYAYRKYHDYRGYKHPSSTPRRKYAPGYEPAAEHIREEDAEYRRTAIVVRDPKRPVTIHPITPIVKKPQSQPYTPKRLPDHFTPNFRYFRSEPYQKWLERFYAEVKDMKNIAHPSGKITFSKPPSETSSGFSSSSSSSSSEQPSVDPERTTPVTNNRPMVLRSRYRRRRMPIMRRRMRIPLKRYTGGPRGEIKTLDFLKTTLPAVNSGHTSEIIPMNLMSQGTAFYQRVGNRVTGKSVEAWGQIHNASTAAVPVRLLCFYDSQPNGVSPAASDVLKDVGYDGSSTTNAMAGRNSTTTTRFRSLWDRYFVLQLSSSPDTNFASFNFWLPVTKYKFQWKNTGATISDVSTGILYFMILADVPAAAGDVNVIFSSRFRYTDA